jgi:hypothetical protein
MSYMPMSALLALERNITYMRLVHNAEGDLGLAAILLRQLLPDVCQLRIGRSSLSNNRSVPTCIVVDIENAQRCTRVETALDQAVVLTKVIAVQCTAKIVVEQELPAYWQTESVKSIIFDEVVHLPDGGTLLDDVVGLVRSGQGALSVNGASKVKSGDVDTWTSGRVSDMFNVGGHRRLTGILHLRCAWRELSGSSSYEGSTRQDVE